MSRLLKFRKATFMNLDHMNVAFLNLAEGSP
jgi:hypothetical protein